MAGSVMARRRRRRGKAARGRRHIYNPVISSSSNKSSLLGYNLCNPVPIAGKATRESSL